MKYRIALLLGLTYALVTSAVEAKKKDRKTPNAQSQTSADSAPNDVAAPMGNNPKVATSAVESAAAPANSGGQELSEQLDEEPSVALGEDPFGSSSHGSLRTLLQVRYRSTLADESALSTNSSVAEQQRGTVKKDDGFDIQRAFLRYVASPSKNVNAKFLVDFAELWHGNSKQSFKLAYVELNATRRLRFDFGLLKRTYSLLELLPIAKHELADLGPTDNFIKDQGYGGRDIGVVVRYQPLPSRRMMMLSLGAFRGDIDEGFDASPLKAITARIETHPMKHLRLGVNAVLRPYDNVKMVKTKVENSSGGTDTVYVRTTMLKKGLAAGTDATLMYRHLELRGELLVGKSTDNTDAVYPRVQQGSFWAAWVVVAPKIEIGKWVLVPAAKAEVLDTDALDPNGQRRVITGVVGVVTPNGVRVIADVTRTWTDPHLTSSTKVPWTSGTTRVWVPEPSWTSATVQAQVVF